MTTAGYSAFRAERVRGKIAIPKESIYLFQTSASNGLQNPPADLVSSVEALHKVRNATRSFESGINQNSKNWMLLREDLLQGISPSAKNTSLGDDTVGVHYYDNQQLNVDDNHFNPPHKDSGLFTVLLQKPGDDLLEIAGLDSTEQTGSETIGKRTAFWPVSFMPGEVIVLAGKGLERLLGSDRVRACVHRVRKPATKNIVSRLSIAIFCSPPAGSLTPGTLI